METISYVNNGKTMFVVYARFCGDTCESFAASPDESKAGKFDVRQVRLIRALIDKNTRYH